MSTRMVEVRRTVTVISRVPVENYSTGHSLKDDGHQMTDDEIINFEMRADAGENLKAELAEAVIEAIQMEPDDQQDYSVKVLFYDTPEVDNAGEVVQASSSSDPKPYPG